MRDRGINSGYVEQDPFASPMAEQDPQAAAEDAAEALLEIRRKAEAIVDRRISNAPRGWSEALSDVLDTYETCHLHVVAVTGTRCNEMALGLTELVINRKAQLENLAQQEED